MTIFDRLVFWEPTVSPHKADMFEALAARAPELRVVSCSHQPLPRQRLELGAAVPAPRRVEHIVAPSSEAIAALLDESPESTLHVFAGIRWVPTLVEALRIVQRRTELNFAVMSEPRDAAGMRGLLRRAQSRLTEGWIRRRARFVLAQGRNGPPWFLSVGYAPERVFPFAYFVDPPSLGAAPADIAPGPVRVGYVGRIDRAKGVFDTLDAVAELGPDATLTVVGAGPDGEAFAARSAGLAVRQLGIVANAELGPVLRDMDVLVLASNCKDGWGVVVSEALMCGTAAIATAEVGASMVLENPLFGRVCQRDAPGSIAAAVRELRDAGAFSANTRARRAAAARSTLSADAGASHLLRILRWSEGRGPRPASFHLLAEAI